MPVIVNRLPADLKARITNISLIALGRDATWEVHALDWVPGLAAVGDPIDAELANLPKVPLLCLYGAGEDSLCTSLGAGRAIVGTIGKGHHFGGDYDEVADRVLEFSRDQLQSPLKDETTSTSHPLRFLAAAAPLLIFTLALVGHSQAGWRISP